MSDKSIELLEEINQMQQETRDKEFYIKEIDLVKEEFDFNQTLENSHNYIKSFYQKNNKSILSLYKEVKDDKGRTKIKIEDVNLIIQSYLDYYDGLKSFIKEVQEKFIKVNSMSEENKKKIVNVLFEMIEKDNTFLEEYSEHKEETLEDAIRNIEAGIDLFKLSDKFKDDYKTLFKKLLVDRDIHNILALLFMNSIKNFMNNIGWKVTRTYDTIRDVLAGDVEKDNKCDEPVNREYKLF